MPRLQSRPGGTPGRAEAAHRASRKSRLLSLGCLVVLLFFMLSQGAQARVPQLLRDGHDPAEPVQVQDPLRSWSFYGRLQGGADVRYFRVDLQKGERLHLGLFTPDVGAFSPSLAIIGPGLASEGTAPDFLRVPSGASVVVASGYRGPFHYEPLVPGAYVFTTELDVTAPAAGSYLLAVFERSGSGGGAFGLAVGYRAHLPFREWLLLPYSLMQIHLWQGDALLLVVGPAILVVLLGLGLVVYATHRRRGHSGGCRRLGAFQWTAVLAGLLYLGTAATLTVQAVQAVWWAGASGGLAITIVWVVLIIATAALIVRWGWAAAVPSPATRAGLAVLGIAGLALSAGFIVGPLLAVLSALLPRELALWGSAAVSEREAQHPA